MSRYSQVISASPNPFLVQFISKTLPSIAWLLIAWHLYEEEAGKHSRDKCVVRNHGLKSNHGFEDKYYEGFANIINDFVDFSVRHMYIECSISKF
ncbi:hypothetical protein AVEN_150508-1 [Araneus ventricosus]|uniref:Uncharacterized protein n=1 Tax=Araneus ventricosus TaxID=182803 RepID=A0A4Y2M4B8_ARAVE|nr:hypothetical protein AVEN_150508-1 [Araneus ventricosus]